MAVLEIKIFCIIGLVALFLFKTFFSTLASKRDIPLFLLTVLGIVFSLAGELLSATLLKIVFFSLCAVSYAAATVFLLYKEKIIVKLPAALAAVVTLFSVHFGLNLTTYALVFGIVATFIYEQHDTIRRDKLTKLHNRYGMDLELKEQLRQYKRDKTDSFYIIACDLDKFKEINDTWGHPEGDRALELVAGVLAKVGKKFKAEVFRIGGDEFVIIADTSSESLAQAIVAAIQNGLDQLVFRDDFTIEMSIGFALYNGEDPIDDVLAKADKKLYEAKRQ